MIYVSCSPGEWRVAVLEPDGTLLDYAIDRPGRPNGVGDLLRGRVVAHVPAMAGAFVALPDAEGFLPDSAGAAGLGAGDAIRVRITRAAQGGKGPRLTVDGTTNAGPPMLIARGPCAALRLAALHPSAPVLVDDPAVAALWRGTLGDRLRPGGFDDAIEAQVDALAGPTVALPLGMAATITPTPALIAIDVDLGAATAGRVAKVAVQRDANRAAIPALARQVRLRNLGGAIVIDLAGMPIRRRAALAPDFVAALASDPIMPRFLGFSALGLAEILRPRVHPPLHALLAGPHAAGLVALRQLDRDCAADPATARHVVAAPDVHRALADDAVATGDVLRRTGRPLVVRSDPTLAPGTARVERDEHG